MKSNERIQNILLLLKKSDEPISGNTLAGMFNVSRQIIVKDISALKEQGHNIISTTRGYILQTPPLPERIFKVVHEDEETETELMTIVKSGAEAVNVFVWHKIYGKISVNLDIATIEDVNNYMTTLKSGRSSPLKNVTNQYHYHLVKAPDISTLDTVERELDKLGFLVENDYHSQE